MSRIRAVPFAPAVVAIAAASLLAACGGSVGGASGPSVAVTATNDACKVATTTLAAGPVTFTVKNTGSKVTEVYVYGEKGGSFSRIVGEVENIGPGTSRDLSVKLASGTYEIACKPGEKGAGIRTKITVSGAKAQSAS